MSKSRKIFIACPHDFDELSAYCKYWQSLSYHVISVGHLRLAKEPFREGVERVLSYDAIALVGDWELCMFCRAYHAIAVANCTKIYYDQV